MGKMFNLNGHISVITGAAQGLGKYMARVLAQAGSDIVIADINLEKATEASKKN
jgi:NAD(P)-dependent dehydrogenase (short-subunit alcohol dehydrogenase family)